MTYRSFINLLRCWDSSVRFESCQDSSKLSTAAYSEWRDLPSFFFFFFVPHCDFQIGPDQAKTWRPPGPGGVSQWFIDGDVKSGLSLRPGRWPCPCSRLHRNLPDYHLIPPSCDRSQKREEVLTRNASGVQCLALYPPLHQKKLIKYVIQTSLMTKKKDCKWFLMKGCLR